MTPKIGDRNASVNVYKAVPQDFFPKPKEVMTSGRAGGLKNREPLKADFNGRHLKVAFALLPGPGARTLRAEIMRHLCFQGTGEQTVLGTPPTPLALVGATGRSPDRPASFCGNQREALGRAIPRPMLSARNVLAPGPRPRHPGNVKL